MNYQLSDIGILNRTTEAFVNKENGIKELLGDNNPLWQIDAAIEGKKGFSEDKRNTLSEALLNFYSKIELNQSHLVYQQIESLKSKNTFTVTTGQQLHPILGPAFVIYKIVDILKTSEHFKKIYPNYNFIPVFWLASEDHDYEEIKKLKLFNKTLNWETQQNGAIGRFTNNGIDELFNTIYSEFSLYNDQKTFLKEIELFYQNEDDFAMNTAKIIHHFFGKYGIIVLNGDDKSLKKQFKPYIKKDILDENNYNSFNKFSEQLKNKSLSLQLTARPINFFYIKKDIRERIEKTGNKYQVLNTNIVFSKEEIEKEIEINTENFSPNAVLRPLYQEVILPNVCYIGGNAEINYWIQLKEIFKNNQVVLPFLKLRTSVLILKNNIIEFLEKHHIDIIKLIKSKNESELLQLIEKEDFIIKELIQELKNFKEKSLLIFNKKQLKDYKNLIEQFNNLEKEFKKKDIELINVQKEKNITQFNKILKIKNSELDIKTFQERNLSVIEIVLNYKNAIEILVKEIKYGENNLQIIDLNN